MAAIEDILQALKRRKAPDQGLLQIGFANVTSYRPEVKTWVMQRPEPVWCLQETHLAGAEHERKVHELRRSKKVVHSQQAYPTEAGGTSGGVLTLASAHLNVQEGPGWMQDGKGFQISHLRNHGWTLHIVNVYLCSGVGPSGGVNPALLSALATELAGLAGQWVVVGDWNCEPEELSATGFLQMVHGELMVPRHCTTSQGSCLDYVVMSKPLCACSDVAVEVDVPFAPHLAVLLSIRKAWGQAIVRQLPQFIAKPTKQEKSAGKNISMVSLPGATSQEPLDLSWAAFTSEVEAGMFEQSQSGRQLH